MKKFYSAILLTMISLGAFAQWVNLGNQGFTNVAVQHSSMTIDQAGLPVVGYINQTTRLATIMKYQTGVNAWDTLGNANMAGGSADQIKMATDAAGDIYAAYASSAAAGISVKKLVGSTWTLVGTASPTGAIANSALEQYWDFDVSAAGVPYIIYFEAVSNDPKVIRFNGTSWASVGTLPAPTAINGSANIEINPGGNPVISYVDDGGYTIKVLRYNGTSWINASAAGDIVRADLVDVVRMALTSTGQPVLVFREYNAASGGNGFANMLRPQAGTWVNVGPTNFNNAPYFDMSFAIDNTDAPIVAYPDASATGSNKANVLRFVSGTWTAVGNPLFTTNGINYPTVVTDNAGNPYVSFQDWAFGDYNTVVKLASNPLSLYDLHLLGTSLPGKNALTCAVDASIAEGILVLERSTNGSDFVSIANTIVDAEIVANKFAKWSDIAMLAENNYYRVKYLDATGQGTYTNIVSLGTLANDKVNLYPNPATDFIYIQSTEQGEISIYNLVGTKVSTASASSIGTNIVSIANLPSGMYVVRLNDKVSQRFVKQ
jgi:hypothetical protein